MSQPLNALSFPLWGSRLIEASAGTGKTWTIAALYVRLVLGHARPGADGPDRAETTASTEAGAVPRPPLKPLNKDDMRQLEQVVRVVKRTVAAIEAEA